MVLKLAVNSPNTYLFVWLHATPASSQSNILAARYLVVVALVLIIVDTIRAAAGAIDRVFNLGLAIPKLEDVTVEALQSKFNAFCKLCGHYSPTPCQGRTILSQTWIDAIEKYKAP